MTDIIAWERSLSVGDDNLDNQHKWLIQILNKLATNDFPDDLKFLDHVLSELEDYAQTHFRDEERLMIKTDFKDIKNHVDLHIKFEKRLIELREKYIDHKDFDHATEMAKTLKDWFIEHIKIKDKEYAKDS